MTTLHRYERLLVTDRPNHYKILGPGAVWLAPWYRVLTKFYIGPQDMSRKLRDVCTTNATPVDMSVHVLFHIDPELIPDAMLPMIPPLSASGWQETLSWRLEQVIRRLATGCDWRRLMRGSHQRRLERQATMTLSDHLTPIGIKITSTSIVRVDLPTELREAIIVSEHNDIYADSRISLLQKYPKVFGAHPEQTMSHCTQWELLNLLHQNGELQVILAAPNLSLDTLPPRIEQSHPTLIDQSG